MVPMSVLLMNLYKYVRNILINLVLVVGFDALRLSQQCFSHVMTFSGLNQY